MLLGVPWYNEPGTGGAPKKKAPGSAPESPYVPPPPIVNKPAPTIGVPGFDPDYASLLAADPTLVGSSGDIDAYVGSLGDARRAAIRRSVIRSGFVPGQVAEDVDQATIDAANANQFSTKAQLGVAKTHADTDLSARLAARGILDSGGLAGGAQRNQTNYEQGSSEGVNALLDFISGVETDTTGKINDARAQQRALREQAASRIAADPRYQPLGETDAVLDPVSGLYVTPDGRWYTSDGKRANAPVQSGSNDIWSSILPNGMPQTLNVGGMPAAPAPGRRYADTSG